MLGDMVVVPVVVNVVVVPVVVVGVVVMVVMVVPVEVDVVAGAHSGHAEHRVRIIAQTCAHPPADPTMALHEGMHWFFST